MRLFHRLPEARSLRENYALAVPAGVSDWAVQSCAREWAPDATGARPRAALTGRLPGMADAADSDIVVIHTDGGCSGNPGPGGWGAVLRYGRHVKEIYGGEDADTTNNRMELMAAIRALESLTRPSRVRLHTDSSYLRNGIQSWMARWKRNGWVTSERKPVKNADLWQRLEAAIAQHEVVWLWVKGHAGDPGNERADALANQGVREAIRRRL